MQISDGPLSYTFHDHWARIPDTASGRRNGRTHGVACLPDGGVAVFHQASPALLIFEADGSLRSSACDFLVGAHGLTMIPGRDGGDLSFWLTDQESCAMLRVGLDGRELQRLEVPPAPSRPDDAFCPTWVDAAPDGSLVVADGYGGSALHRYGADGEWQEAVTELGAGGRLACPHAIRFDPDGNLWIADRGNRRVLKTTAAGEVLAESTTACHSPCGFAFHEGNAYVPELFGGLKVLDGDLNVVASLGQHPEIARILQSDGGPWEPLKEMGWPDVADSEVKPGRFNSPHGVDVDTDGNVYVVEWIVGGRIIKLERI